MLSPDPTPVGANGLIAGAKPNGANEEVGRAGGDSFLKALTIAWVVGLPPCGGAGCSTQSKSELRRGTGPSPPQGYSGSKMLAIDLHSEYRQEDDDRQRCVEPDD